jgi:hypothetical protein
MIMKKFDVKPDTINRWDAIEIIAREVERVSLIEPETPYRKRLVTLSAVEEEYCVIMDQILALPSSDDGASIKTPPQEEVDSWIRDAGAWTKNALSGCGVSWPPRNGWREQLRRKWEERNE